MLFVVSILCDELRHRVRQMHASGRDRGASALEWAIIAAISVVIATIIGAVVYNVVSNKSSDIQKCGDQPVGSKC
jgi:hypothetical protein